MVAKPHFYIGGQPKCPSNSGELGHVTSGTRGLHPHEIAVVFYAEVKMEITQDIGRFGKPYKRPAHSPVECGDHIHAPRSEYIHFGWGVEKVKRWKFRFI